MIEAVVDSNIDRGNVGIRLSPAKYSRRITDLGGFGCRIANGLRVRETGPRPGFIAPWQRGNRSSDTHFLLWYLGGEVSRTCLCCRFVEIWSKGLANSISKVGRETRVNFLTVLTRGILHGSHQFGTTVFPPKCIVCMDRCKCGLAIALWLII